MSIGHGRLEGDGEAQEMELSPLRTFLAIAREGNMTRAAAELHLTQPAVSAQLARLEEELGQRLFDRRPKGMTLTEAGRVFRQYVEESLGTIERGLEALDELAGLERGSLAIGGGATATTYLLPTLLGAFHERSPAIRLFVREQGSADVVDAILSGELELGVVTLPVGAPAQGRGALDRLEIEPWLVDELRLIVPPGHRLRGRDVFEWSEIDGEPMVLFEAGSAVRELLDRQIGEAHIHTETVMELRSIESIKQMVEQGIGAAFVSRFALVDPGGGLRCADGPIERELAIVYRTDRTPSPAARVFVEMMRGAEFSEG
jgi:LysR family cyn operon transcriptional activator